MILEMTLAWQSELPCQSDSGPQLGVIGSSSGSEVVPPALGLSDLLTFGSECRRPSESAR